MTELNNLQKKIGKFLNSHNYTISEQNLNLLTNKLYKSNLFENYEEQFNYVNSYQSGGANLPSEYFGVNSDAYINSNTGTNTSPTNNATRPAITSEVFPMEGGACPCMTGGMSGGMFKGCGFFTNTDMRNFKSQNLLNYDNKLLKENKEFLNNKLSVYLHRVMKKVKNKQHLIGKSHIMGA